MSPRIVGRTLRSLRAARRLTQVELAERVQVSQAYLAHLERGRKDAPSMDVLLRLAAALGVAPEALLLKDDPARALLRLVRRTPSKRKGGR